MYDESDATLGRLAYDSRFNGERVPVIAYRLTNGQGDEYPAGWALPESDITRALEYFIERDDRRPPFVQWRDDGQRATVAKHLPEMQPKEKTEFTVVLQAVGETKIEVIREIRALARLGLKEAEDHVEVRQRTSKRAWRKTRPRR
jgi:hypothetical protein